MTLLEIIQLALSQLGEQPNSDTVADYKQEYNIVGLVNEGYVDICLAAYRPVTVEEVQLSDDCLLSPATLQQVLLDVRRVTCDGQPVAWCAAPEEALRVSALPGSTVALDYTYLPAPLTADADIPAFPPHYHPALADYAVYRVLLVSASNVGKRQAAMLHYDRFLSRVAALRRERQGQEGLRAWKFINKYNW